MSEKYNSFASQKNAYNSIAHLYESHMGQTFVGRLNKFVYEYIIKISEPIKQEDKILDIGCGDGILLNQMSKKYFFKHGSGFDASEKLIEIANKNKVRENISFYVDDASNFISDNKYNMTFSLALIHRLEDIENYFKCLHKISEINSKHYVTTMNNISPQFILIRITLYLCKLFGINTGNQIAKIGFYPNKLKEIINSQNFEIESIHSIGFFHNFMPFKSPKLISKLFDILDKILMNIPIINMLGVFSIFIIKPINNK